MEREISESDWKQFRNLHPLALDRFCANALAEIDRLASDLGKGAHERYIAVFQLLQRQQKEMSGAFDDFRRSTARRQLAVIRSLGLLTEDEFARFSPETRNAVQALLTM